MPRALPAGSDDGVESHTTRHFPSRMMGSVSFWPFDAIGPHNKRATKSRGRSRVTNLGCMTEPWKSGWMLENCHFGQLTVYEEPNVEQAKSQTDKLYSGNTHSVLFSGQSCQSSSLFLSCFPSQIPNLSGVHTRRVSRGRNDNHTHTHACTHPHTDKKIFFSKKREQKPTRGQKRDNARTG